MSACLSVHEHISGTARPTFTKFCAQMPCGRGSVIFWRRYDTLCTSGFMDDVAFVVVGRMAKRGRLYPTTTSGVAIPWRSLMSMNVLFVLVVVLSVHVVPQHRVIVPSLLRPGSGAEYCDQFICLSVCMSVCVCLSVRKHISGIAAGLIFTEFLCRSPVAVPRSSSGGVAIRYVLSVLWIIVMIYSFI